MRILVTGGCGFIGKNLINNLVHKHTVMCLDNNLTSTMEETVEGCEYIYGNTKDCMMLSHNNFDLIYHLGEYSRVERSFEDIDVVFENNWNSIYQVLKLAKDCNAKLVYAGSSTKFGDNDTNYRESPYAYTKYCNAELVKTYCDWHNLRYAITYFYNVYGEGEIDNGPYATVIGKFLRAKKEGKKVDITGDGKQVRNFTHIEDIVDALMIVAEKGQGDRFGIGSDVSYSILQVAELLDLDYRFIPDRRGNRKISSLITKNTRDLGWKPKKDLQNYLKKVR